LTVISYASFEVREKRSSAELGGDTRHGFVDMARIIDRRPGGHQMRTAATITFVLLSVTGAQTQTAVKNVISGNPLKLAFFNSTNPDCSSRGRSTIRLIRAPEHGRVNFRLTADFPSSRSQCHQRRVPGTAFYYQSQRGFAGTDHVEVEVIFPSGSLGQYNYTINVIP
jgi:hypothetical protein